MSGDYCPGYKSSTIWHGPCEWRDRQPDGSLACSHPQKAYTGQPCAYPPDAKPSIWAIFKKPKKSSNVSPEE